ncbi:hypothetical protein KY289_001174 [Solanum tuberosum]|nr:hypothetical protein KY289_001174 [Solanum tuberosum]
MDAFNSLNPQMVVDVNYKLRSWWIDTKRDHEKEIRQLLGGLTYLIFVIPNPHLIRALLEFWDPVRMVFKFVDFDLTPTIKEISGFIDMSYHECEMMVPYKPSSREFLQSLGMKSNPTLPSLDLGWIHFDFVYARFGQDDSYYTFSDEFECSVEEWETYRLNAFAIALLGFLVFPKIRGNIDTRFGYVAIEHFYIRSDAVDIFLGYGNKIDNHPRRMIAFTTPALCTREYYIWILKEVKNRKLSGEGYHGITDERKNIWARNTMVYHTRSKDTLPPLPNENRKGKKKETNEKVMSKTIEKKHPSDELVSSLKKKIRELEVSDMRRWVKLLLSVDPTLGKNIDKPHVTSQATLQDNPPPTHLTSHPPPTTPLLKISLAPFKCLQRTPTFQITHILLNIMLMLPELHILL